METQLRFMGGFDLRDTEGAQVRLPTRKSLALLAVLAQSGGQRMTRDRLATLLWPRSEDTQARASLRQELAVLRKALAGSGLPRINADKDALSFHMSGRQLDTARLNALAQSDRTSDLRNVAELYRGEFLAGLAIRSTRFDEWLWIERQQLRDAAIAALTRLLQIDRRSGTPDDVLATAQALLRADATNETAYLGLMEALRTCGRRTDALKYYQRFCGVLRRELDADPSDAIANLAEEIRLSTGAAPPPSTLAQDGVAAHISRRLNRLPAHGQSERRKTTLAVLGLADVCELGVNFAAPELAEAQEALVQRAAAAIDDYGGSFVPCAGDRILACFGHPTADEHDSERAVLAALGIVSEPIPLSNGTALWPRAAVARGDTLISSQGAGRGDVGLVGIAVHLATRLEQMAKGREVLVSPETHGLVHRLFETSELIRPGADMPDGYVILRERLRSNRFDVRKLSARLSALVGREEDLEKLREAWGAARDGRGQAVIVEGEPGIGKSRLLHAFLQTVLSENPQVIQINASPLHRQSALFAIVQFLEEEIGFDRTPDAGGRHARLSAWAADLGLAVEEVVPPLFALLSGPAEDEWVDSGRGLQDKTRLFSALLSVIRARAEARALILLVEDLHWLDPMSGEFLRFLLPRIEAAPILVVMTVRADAAPGWVGRLRARHIFLGRLNRLQARMLVSDLLPKGTPRSRYDGVVARSDGIPLYLEELAKSLAETETEAGQPDGPGRGIPDSLEASLMARIDRLDSAREVLQVASVFGKVFDQDHLQVAMGLSPEVLETRLRQLQEADLIYRIGRSPQARYEFNHVLVQELTYRSLPPDRRTASHLQIANALVRQAGKAGPKSPEIVARHFAMGGQTRKAIEFFDGAGRMAARVSAHQEAAAHFRAALALLPELPEGAVRARLEFDLLLQLGPQVLATQGFAASDVAEIYERARDLVVHNVTRADPEERDRILWGLWGYFLVRGDISASYGLAAEFLANALEHGDPVSIQAGNQMLGLCSFYRGKLVQALDYLEKAQALYSTDQAEAHLRRYGLNLSVAAWAYLSWTLSLRGEAKRAVKECERNLEEADRLQHDFSQVVARVFATGTFLFLGDEASAARHAQLSADLPELRRFSQMRAQAAMQVGRLAERNGDPEGIETLRTGLQDYQATGAALAVPQGKAWVAQGLLAAGDIAEALETVETALDHSERTGVLFFDAELHRVRGLCLNALLPDRRELAEAAFEAALEAGRETGALLLSLRTAADYAEALQSWGRGKEAARLLRDAAELGAEDTLPEVQRIAALMERMAADV